MKTVEFYVVYDTDGNVVGDMDPATALERYDSEVANEEFTVRKIVFQLPEPKPIEVSIPESEPTVKVG